MIVDVQVVVKGQIALLTEGLIGIICILADPACPFPFIWFPILLTFVLLDVSGRHWVGSWLADARAVSARHSNSWKIIL